MVAQLLLLEDAKDLAAQLRTAEIFLAFAGFKLSSVWALKGRFKSNPDMSG